MRVYETTFILSPQSDDAAFDRQIKSVVELIEKQAGKVIHLDRMGIRRLAYPIRKFTQGYFANLVFEGNAAVLSDLDRFYRLEEPYIRNLTLLYERAPLEDPEAKPEKPEPAKKPIVQPKPAVAPPPETKPEPEVETKTTPEPAEEAKTPVDSTPKTETVEAEADKGHDDTQPIAIESQPAESEGSEAKDDTEDKKE